MCFADLAAIRRIQKFESFEAWFWNARDAWTATELHLTQLLHAGILTTAVLACVGMRVNAGCPVTGSLSSMGGMGAHSIRNLMNTENTSEAHIGFPVYDPAAALPPLTPELYEKISADIDTTLRTSQDFWPADFGYYGGLLIRLAWHCSGTYRQSDGRGGCDGSRIRFAPELHWEDNANLDKAMAILEPLHEKYAEHISWCAFSFVDRLLQCPCPLLSRLR